MNNIFIFNQLDTRVSEPGRARHPHYFQKHVLAPPTFGPSTSSQSAKVIYTHRKAYLHMRKPYNHHTKALWHVASPVHRNQAIHCTVRGTVLNTTVPVILFLLCLHVISVVQIFPGSRAVRSLNSRKSA